VVAGLTGFSKFSNAENPLWSTGIATLLANSGEKNQIDTQEASIPLVYEARAQCPDLHLDMFLKTHKLHGHT
jgi:hypothetical protein